MTRKEEIFYNDGIWYAVQELVFRDEPTLAKDVVKSAGLDKKEMRRCQKKSGFLDEVMRKFINENCYDL